MNSKKRPTAARSHPATPPIRDHAALAALIGDAGISLLGMLEQAFDGIMILDGSGSIVYANGPATSIFAIPSHGLLGSSIDMVIPTQVFDGRHRPVMEFVASMDMSRPMNRTLRNVAARRSDGTVFSVDVTIGTLIGSGQHRIHFAAFKRDGSEQAQREHALKESARTLQDLLTFSHSGVWEYNLSTHRHTWDDTFFALCGMDKATVTPGYIAVMSVVHPSDRTLMHTHLTTHIRSGEPFAFELRVGNTERGFRWMSAQGYVHRDATNAPSKIIGFIQDIHDRKVTADRLRELHDASKVALWEHDFETGENYWDDNVYRLLGFEPGSVPPQDVTTHSLMVPEDSRATRRYLDDRIRSNSTDFEYTYRVELPNGSIRWIHDIGHIFRRPDGQLLKIIGTMQDVTAMKVLEDRLRRTLAASRAGAWEFNFISGEGFWSEEDYALYGYEKGTIKPSFDAIVARIHPDDLQEFLRVTKENIAVSDSIELTYRIMLPGDRVRWITDFGRIERDTAGHPLRMYGIAVDITNIKASQQAIEDIYNATPDGVIIADIHTNFLRTNRTMEMMTGYSEQELAGMTLRDLHPVRDLDWVLQRFMDAYTGQLSRVLDIPVQRKDGSIFYADISTNRIIHNGQECLIGFFHDASSRIAYQRQLQESKEQFERIVQTAQEGIWVIDMQGNTTFANPRLCEMLEVPLDGIVGSSFYDYMDEESRLIATASLAHPFDSPSNQYDLKLITRSGRHVWAIASTKPLMNTSGDVVGILSMIMDITERRMAEEEITAAEAKFSAIFRSIPVQITIVRAEDNVIVDANEEFFRQNKLHPSDIGERTAEQLGLITPDEYRRMSDTFAAHGHIKGMEVAAVVQGESRSMIVSAEIVQINNRPHVLTTSFDITERKAATQKLVESENRLRLITSTIQEVFWMADPSINRMVYISPGYERVWGRTVESLYANPRSFVEAIHPDDRDRVLLVLKRQTEGVAFNHQYRIQHPDGTIRWVRDQGFPVYNDDGNLTYFVGVAQDITDQRIADEQFMRSQRLESLGTIASGIAHDLNNILTPIMTGTSVLKFKIKEPELRHFLDTMEKSVNRGAEIIKQILTFGRGVGNEQVSLNPRSVVKDLESFIVQTFPKNIQIRTAVETSDLRMVADPTQIHQVRMNLCVNARDAMPSGGILEILVRPVEVDLNMAAQLPDAKPGRYIEFTVKDTGIGISDEIRGRIFDPFFTTKEVGKGTGLGLFSSLSIIKNHGGFITLKSQPGHGTSLIFYIPVDLRLQESVPSVPALPLSEAVGHGETILVIDDEKSIREIVESTLRTYGYTVITATDGADALARHGGSMDAIDLVLSDIAMPILDGVAIVRVIRDLKPKMRIVMMTGLKTRNREMELKELGVVTFIDKPFSAETVLHEIHQTLHR